MRLAHFQIHLELPYSTEETWLKLWDLSRHTRSVPFTEIGKPLPKLDMGVEFIARTRLGGFAFEDVMVVTAWSPYSYGQIRKIGSKLRGDIHIRLRETEDGATLSWQQSFGWLGLPYFATKLVTPIVRAGYRHSLKKILEV